MLFKIIRWHDQLVPNYIVAYDYAFLGLTLCVLTLIFQLRTLKNCRGYRAIIPLSFMQILGHVQHFF